MKRVVLAAIVAGGLVAPAAQADGPPSRWETAKDPDAAAVHALHVEVQRRLVQTERDRFGVGESQVLAAKTKLERAGAATHRDPRLRFDLGLVYSKLKDFGRAAAIYRAALAYAPDHPAAEEAWLRLAFACGHVGDHECERTAYLRVLRLETEELLRATPTLNLAETEMHLGNLREAIELYEEALRLAGRSPSRDTVPLALWGLAVAHDRSADRQAAEKTARFALEVERSAGVRNLLHTPDVVFFYPSWEIHWYEGLGAAAQARVEQDAVRALDLWRNAERSFDAYVRAAERSAAAGAPRDRWLDLAKARLASIKVDRVAAEKRRGKERPRPREDEDVAL